MVLSTPAKAASAVAVTSVSAVGVAFTYKYMNGLYSIEKIAIEEASWQVEDPKDNVENSPTSLIVSVFVQRESSSTPKHGITEGNWKCEIIATSSNSEGLTAKKQDLKNALNSYFVGYASSGDSKVVKISEEVRAGFVNHCSKNRKLEKQTNSKVTAEVKVSLDKLTEDITTIFGGISDDIPLNSVEEKIYAGTDIKLTESDFSVVTTDEPKKVTGTITASNENGKNKLGEGETWVCTVEGTPVTGTSLTPSPDVTGLKSKLTEILTKPENKQGLIKSCARNRTSKFSENTVQSTLKLSVSKESTGNKLKFDEGQWASVVAGTWINLA